LVCVAAGGAVAAGGVDGGAVVGGCVCADDADAAAIIAESAITMAEDLI
jgi:hypothetical protein